MANPQRRSMLSSSNLPPTRSSSWTRSHPISSCTSRSCPVTQKRLLRGRSSLTVFLRRSGRRCLLQQLLPMRLSASRPIGPWNPGPLPRMRVPIRCPQLPSMINFHKHRLLLRWLPGRSRRHSPSCATRTPATVPGRTRVAPTSVP